MERQMENNKTESEKIKEWIHICRAILKAYEIFVFILATEEELIEKKIKLFFLIT